MVHLLPGNWDQWHDGEEVEVWVNTNQPSAELFLNGESLGKKSFDEKETAYGKKYYETSEKHRTIRPGVTAPTLAVTPATEQFLMTAS